MKKLFLSMMLVLSILVILASTTFAAHAESDRQLLLKGSVEATETQQPVFPINYISLTGSGNATQLGLYTYTLQAELYIPTLAATSTATFVAADGSSLFAQGTGQGTPTGTPGIVSIVETLTITGGTGRFEGATGNITIQRLVNRATFASTGTLDGTIILP